jgi:hypothetical protein
MISVKEIAKLMVKVIIKGIPRKLNKEKVKYFH